MNVINGQAWLINSSTNTKNTVFAADYVILGCLQTSAGTIPSYEGKDHILDGAPSSRSNVIEKCARAAWTKGYQVFGIHKGACHTSATAEDVYTNSKKIECKLSTTMYVYNFTGKQLASVQLGFA